MLYYSLETPAGLERSGPATGEMAETLESLVAAWGGEVGRARHAERLLAGSGTVPAPEEVEVLRRSHRALVETLERSISQLEALHRKTAAMVRHLSEAPAPAPVPAGPESGLCLTATGPTEFPTSDETEIIDATNRLALATLDVSRWRPLKRRRILRQSPRP